MTEKKRAILNAALKLFSEQGYDAVPTSLIAKGAEVSEGLIFRHFHNKHGLLEAIILTGKTQIEDQVVRLKELETPQLVIQEAMEIPFKLPSEYYSLWRLIYSLKFKKEMSDNQLFEPIYNVVLSSLKELKYAEPELEAHLIVSYIDGFMMTVLLNTEVSAEDLLRVLQKKYAIQ
jgi:AcrR family transcriptional regulator